MLHPERAKRACGEYLECLAVEQGTARIIRFVLRIVTERLETPAKIGFRERSADLQADIETARLAGNGRRSITASAVETRKIGFLDFPRRRSTAARRPAISRDGSS